MEKIVVVVAMLAAAAPVVGSCSARSSFRTIIELENPGMPEACLDQWADQAAASGYTEAGLLAAKDEASRCTIRDAQQRLGGSSSGPPPTRGGPL